MTEADDAHGQAKGGLVHESSAFKAQAQAAEPLEPSEGALDHVAAYAQAAAMRRALLGQEGNDPACPEPLALGLAVVAAVGQHGGGFVPGRATLARDRRHGLDQGLKLGDLVPVGRRGVHGQGDAATVGEQVIFGAAATTVGRRGSCFVAAAQGPDGRRIDRRPAPVNFVRVAQLSEQDAVQPGPYAQLVPLMQAHPARRPAAAAHLARQVVPGQSCLEHKEDAGKRRPVVQGLAAGVAKTPRLGRRQQPLDQLPKLVLNQ